MYWGTFCNPDAASGHVLKRLTNEAQIKTIKKSKIDNVLICIHNEVMLNALRLDKRKLAKQNYKAKGSKRPIRVLARIM